MTFEEHLQKEHPFKRPNERFCFTYKRNGVRKVYNFPSNSNFFYVGRDNSMSAGAGLALEKDSNLSRNHAVIQYDDKSTLYCGTVCVMGGVFFQGSSLKPEVLYAAPVGARSEMSYNRR